MSDDTERIYRLLETLVANQEKERVRFYRSQGKTDKLVAKTYNELAEIKRGLLTDLKGLRAKLMRIEHNTEYTALKLGKVEIRLAHPNLRF